MLIEVFGKLCIKLFCEIYNYFGKRHKNNFADIVPLQSKIIYPKYNLFGLSLSCLYLEKIFTTMNSYPAIVILEDDVFFGKMIKNFLINQGFKNIRLFHEEEECIKAITNEPTILIIDHHLLKSTGFETIKRIKAINPTIQFIYLSGQKTSRIAVRAFREGALDYIEKNRDTFVHLKESLDKYFKETVLI